MRDIDEIKKVVKYFNNHETTVRDTAKHCDISKSTVYTYLTKVMPTTEALKKSEKNKAERHIRGGEATRKKYLEKRS